MTRQTRTLGALAALAAGGLLAACSTTLTLNSDNLEIAISNWMTEQGVAATSVTCPDDRPLLQGDTFDCQAVGADGNTYTLRVTQTDAAGNVSWEVV